MNDDAGGLETAPRIDPATTIVVTRPEPEAARIVARLIGAGRRALAFPLLAIDDAPDPSALRAAMARLDDRALVVFVSPNAIRHAIAARAGPWPAHAAIGVMGPGSVETLASLGIAAPTHRVVAPAVHETGERFDSEALFAALDDALGLSQRRVARALIVRGNGGRGWLAERLREAGVAVDEVEAYRRTRGVPTREACDALRTLFASGAPVAFVVTSSEAVAHLAPLVAEALAADDASTRAWLATTTLIVPHRRIAEAAQAAGYTRLLRCAPGDRGVLAAIE